MSTPIGELTRGLIAGGLFDHWSRVERAPRWTCAECQFESNSFYESHERTCSHYRRTDAEALIEGLRVGGDAT